VSDGPTLTFDWLCEQIQLGEDVEFSMELLVAGGRAPSSYHVVRVVGCGKTQGVPWIRYLHDAVQSGDQKDGDSTGLQIEHAWLEDLNGNGRLNVGSRNKEMYFAVAESFAPRIKGSVGAPPLITRAGVTNGGSFEDKVTSGALTAVFGVFNFLSGLLPNAERAGGARTAVPAGLKAYVNGREAPILGASPAQVNIQMPVETEPGEAVLLMDYQGRRSNSVGIPVRRVGPGIILIDPSIAGPNRGAVQNQDFSLNTPSNPSAPGGTLVAYVAGMGAMVPAQRTGVPAPPGELVRAAGRVTAKIGGVDAEVSFAGLTPGTLALEQVNVAVPDVPAGEHDLEISVDSAASNRVKVSIGVR
jgi:uncharacterized protein (TIGR03437 family)